MFYKLLSFIVRAIFLCLMFFFCLLISVRMGHSLLFALGLFVVLILAVIVIRILWIGVSEILKSKIISRFMKRFKFTRMDFVLSEHWKAGAKVIKRKRGRKKPLPWFVLTGYRSGKTTLMASAGLPLFSNEPESSLVVPTRTLRWWFFRSAGFLDLSSHFLNKTPAFERAWLRLVKWCGRLPAPAGVIVCVSVSDLLNKEGIDIHLNARHIRTQIEPLMKKVKRRLPVYLFITCCDQLPGFSLWAKKLSPGQRQQELGYYWLNSPIVDGKDPAFLNPFFRDLKNGLDKIRVSMLSGKELDADMLPILDFPEQVAQLQPAIQRYLAALCEPDSYFEQGALGGVWFTATESASHHSTARRTFFLHDLLTNKLPELSRQREIEAIGWGRRYLQHWGALTLFTIALLVLAYCGLSTYPLTAAGPRPVAVAGQIDQLVKIEDASQHPLRYLPFIPVLTHRHQQLEQDIITDTPHQSISMGDVVNRYQQQFRSAQPQQRRDLILNLAQSIITQQAMLDKQPLSELIKQPASALSLSTAIPYEPLTRLHQTVLQRALLQQPEGAEQVQTLRRLLGILVNSDTQWQWIIAPSADFPSINLTDFLPYSTSEEQLDGLWTQLGAKQVNQWIALVRQAAGDQNRLPALEAFEQQWPALRQEKWMTFLLAINQQPLPKMGSKQWQSQLISTDQGNSPAMKFSHFANEQLADISLPQTTPWLKELRRLNQLQQMPATASLVLRAKRFDQSLRQKISTRLHLNPVVLKPLVSDLHIKSWNDWRSSLRAAVSDAIDTPQSSARLTRGLFPVGKTEEKNPLQMLSGKFASLRKSMTPETNDFAVNAVWTLYQTDARLLVSHAMQKSACWLQQQWQSQVLWPMGKNADRLEYDEQQDLAWQYLTDFIRGPAKSVLVIGDNGPEPGQFEGQNPGLTPEFLRVANHLMRPDDLLAMPERENTRNEDELSTLKEGQVELETQIEKLEQKPLETKLISQPATIPGGARLMPTGTQLLMSCDDQQWTLNSMNFSERAVFRWRPGHCSRVTLVILFPGFNLQYDYVGDSAWPDFLRDMADGQQSYRAEDFPQESAQLATLGIKKIMVRYLTSSANTVQQTWKQWQDLNQTMNDNAQAVTEATTNKSEEQSPTVLKGKFSQLPATIAECY